MRQIVHHSPAEARDFFERLAVYSQEYVRQAIPRVAASFPSKNHYSNWGQGRPCGHLAHWTAGIRFYGTIRHFCLNRVSSAHWVIAKCIDETYDTLKEAYDLGLDLRTECVQVVHPDHPAWHGGWVNRLMLGTELRNAGLLRAHPKGKRPGNGTPSMAEFFRYGTTDVDDLDFYWWADGWTAPFEGEVLLVQTPRGGAWFETFSRSQVATMITILRYANALEPGRFDPAYLLAHHCTSARKMDIALPLNVDGIREAVLFSKEHVDDLDWLAELDDYEGGFEHEDDPWMLREMDERQADRAEEDLHDFRFGEIEGELDERGEGVEALRRLGFYVETEESSIVSARIYQRGRDLIVDGVIGPQTLRALDKDLRKWRIR